MEKINKTQAIKDGGSRLINKRKVKSIGVVVAVVALVVTGVMGTLAYQRFINDVKAEGVAEFKLNKCDKYHNPEKTAEWFECDTK